jgi:flagellar L-ring protein precursor FlgH
MNRHHARLLAFGLATSGWLGNVLAFGQTTTSTGRRAGQGNDVPRGETDRRQEPPRAITNDAAQDAAASMRRHGSSLLKATLNAKQDRGQAKLADVSFHAVPEPVPRTLRKHDQVTIIVREESEFRTRGRSQFKKEAEFEARLDEFIQLKLRNAEIEGGALGPNPPSIKASGRRDFKGEGTVDRSDTFTTRVQAEVVDVKPNGTLILQARSHIKTDDEERYFVLTGSCRVEDVNADNTILSTQLFDKDLRHTSKGTVREATRRGWLSHLLDAINPF